MIMIYDQMKITSYFKSIKGTKYNKNKQMKITFYFKPIKSIKYKNLCIYCQRDLGDQNPRQLCNKTYCSYPF